MKERPEPEKDARDFFVDKKAMKYIEEHRPEDVDLARRRAARRARLKRLARY